MTSFPLVNVHFLYRNSPHQCMKYLFYNKADMQELAPLYVLKFHAEIMKAYFKLHMAANLVH